MNRKTTAILTAALAAAFAQRASATLPTVTGRSINMSTSGYVLWIPDNYVQRGSVADLVVHYLGDPTTVRQNLAYSNQNAILVTVNLGAGSSVYENPYIADPNLFANIISEAKTIVQNQSDFPDTMSWDKVAVSSHSAGYGAIRQILKSSTNYSTISSYAAEDSIYASYGNGTSPPPLQSQMVDFKKFALDAKNGVKTMVLAHTKVETYTYCTTEDCADDILAHLALTATPYTTPGLGNMPFFRTAASGNFTMYGEPGADAPAHSLNLQQSGQFLAELNLNSKDVTLGNGATLNTDTGISSTLTYNGSTTGATINGEVQIPRRGGDHTFTVNNGSAASDLIINGRIWGVGATLAKVGSGTLTLAGATANTYSGLFSSRSTGGVLELNKTAGVNAIAGNLQARLDGKVKWLQNNQVADTANLEVNGTLSVADLNGKSETIATLGFFAGTLSLGSGSLTVTGAATANSTTSTAFITGSGLLTAGSINAQGNLTRSGGGVTKMTGTSITIGSTRRLDLTDTKLITPASLSTITSLITIGRNGGAWNGNGGIVTSMPDAAGATARKSLGVATANTIGYGPTRSFAGISVAANDTLLAYTWTGDADLSAGVDGDDYFYIDNGFTSHLTGWRNGDFNYSGAVDADDYWLIDRNNGAPAASPAMTAIPEPTTFALVAAAWTTFRRRSREHERGSSKAHPFGVGQPQLPDA